MNTFKNLSALVVGSAIALGSLSGLAEARSFSHADRSEMSTEASVSPTHSTYWLGRMDTDSGNAKNPALPSYAQARGQETGGPARELIPN